MSDADEEDFDADEQEDEDLGDANTDTGRQNRIADQFSLDNAFDKIDTDHDGQIDLQEFRDALSDQNASEAEIRKFEQFMDRLDDDHSGKIDKSEFEHWWTSTDADLDGDGIVDGVEAALKNLKIRAKKKYHVDIFTSAWEGQIDVVERFIQEDPSMSQARDKSDHGDDNTPLHYAAYAGHTEICRVCVDGGCDINAVNHLGENEEGKEIKGVTPLYMACQQGHLETVKYLLEECRADMSVRDGR